MKQIWIKLGTLLVEISGNPTAEVVQVNKNLTRYIAQTDKDGNVEPSLLVDSDGNKKPNPKYVAPFGFALLMAPTRKGFEGVLKLKNCGEVTDASTQKKVITWGAFETAEEAENFLLNS